MMEFSGRTCRFPARFAILALGLAAISFYASPTRAQSLTEVSSDPFTIPPGQHATEVEPHVFSNGSTLVATFQVGRIAPGGATDIGWATSTDGGATWQHGNLPGLTTGEGTGIFDAASDPAVAYDAAHGVWMIASLPISNSMRTPAVVVSRSTDGLTWQNPVDVAPNVSSSDKSWIVCDSHSQSPYYGHCYVEWDNPYNGDEIFMSTSTDGGNTWGPATATQNHSYGIGGQPLVQPNGAVVVPIEANSMVAFRSTDGGNTWTSPVNIANISTHGDAGGIRSGPLPSAAVDGSGKVYVVWEDCRFRTGCSTNDLVYSTSSDGVTWSAVTRVPIDPTTSTVDHFIPGIGIDQNTSGATAHIAITYYFYPKSSCSTSTCKLMVGFISSPNGGTNWHHAVKLAGPMRLSWLPNSQNGLMVGDYIGTAFSNGNPYGIFEVAMAKSGSTYNQPTFTAQGLRIPAKGATLSSAGDKAIPGIKGDPIEKEYPEKGMPPSKRAAKRSARK